MALKTVVHWLYVKTMRIITFFICARNLLENVAMPLGVNVLIVNSTIALKISTSLPEADLVGIKIVPLPTLKIGEIVKKVVSAFHLVPPLAAGQPTDTPCPVHSDTPANGRTAPA
jgi:hypothetical protein